MNAMQRITLTFALGVALAQPAAVMAADAVADEHSGHHPAPAAEAETTSQPTQATTATGMVSLRERMQEIRRTPDPDRRMQMMEEQMKQMETVMKDMDAGCPKAAGQQSGGMGMMGGKGMGGGKGMHGGMGMSGGDDKMARRMEKLEKRMDMMLMMLMMK